MAEITTRPIDVSTLTSITSSDFQAMRDYWVMVHTILGGAATMRAAGETYLPRFVEEKVNTERPSGGTYDPYEVRRTKAPFTNLYEDISRNLASKPFAKEVQLEDAAPDRLKALSENIDGQGNNLHVFAQDVFQAGIDYAVTWIFVDFTVAPAATQQLTIQQERDFGLRPYWQHITWERMLAVYSDFIDGQEVIIHARIHEPMVTVDNNPELIRQNQAPFQEGRVERIRVLNRAPVEWDIAGKATRYGPATWTLWEIVVDQATSTTTWKMVGEGVFTVGYIPLVKFATGKRVGVSFVYTPPLRTLAYMQVDEYQQESNLQHIMELTCFPMLAGDGVEKEGSPPIALGPRTVLYGGRGSDGSAGSWKIIEPGGQSIEKVMKHLDDTRTEMRDLGMQPLIQSNLTVITTGQVAVKANSTVQKWALMFEDALEQCWKVTADWLNDSYEPEVEVFRDFTAVQAGTDQMRLLLEMRKAGDISRDALVQAAKRFDYLPSDFDPDDDAEALAVEQEGMQPEVEVDPATGQPVQPGGNGERRPGLIVQ